MNPLVILSGGKDALLARETFVTDLYIYIYIDSTVSAFWASSVQVLMSGMQVKLIKPPQMSHTCGTSKPCQSAQTSELVSMRNC